MFRFLRQNKIAGFTIEVFNLITILTHFLFLNLTQFFLFGSIFISFFFLVLSEDFPKKLFQLKNIIRTLISQIILDILLVSSFNHLKTIINKKSNKKNNQIRSSNCSQILNKSQNCRED